jgi:hypothetical protein
MSKLSLSWEKMRLCDRVELAGGDIPKCAAARASTAAVLAIPVWTAKTPSSGLEGRISATLASAGPAAGTLRGGDINGISSPRRAAIWAALPEEMRREGDRAGISSPPITDSIRAALPEAFRREGAAMLRSLVFASETGAPGRELLFD